MTMAGTAQQRASLGRSIAGGAGAAAAAAAEKAAYLHTLGKFRPKVTVFEMDARTNRTTTKNTSAALHGKSGSGARTGTGVDSASTKESPGMAAMREMRKRHRITSALSEATVRLSDEKKKAAVPRAAVPRGGQLILSA